MQCPFIKCDSHKRCHPIDNAKTELSYCIDNAISAQSQKLPMHWQRLGLRFYHWHCNASADISMSLHLFLSWHRIFNARTAQSKRELGMRHSRVWHCQCKNCAFCIGRAYHRSWVELYKTRISLKLVGIKMETNFPVSQRISNIFRAYENNGLWRLSFL